MNNQSEHILTTVLQTSDRGEVLKSLLTSLFCEVWGEDPQIFYVRNEVRSLNFIARLRKKDTLHFSSIQTLKCPKKAHFSFTLNRF